ncbi:hypothetical protein D0867_14046 [Hortaea werneckii]|uniref:F-box domain-containing protein n=1 Tax=Hortaea werneckii TaxID=91943 RepID=A0A3M6XTU1_HORWE|nr:hypothetical protein D0867_14046 [Hortaea werneckii]RMY22013.1 hypothetical protein D0866_12076 [Hortaea werneckii]
MLELPAELHLRIAECLSQDDLFNFRLSCKTLLSPGHSVLFSPQKASRLYIHPTTIQRYIDICHADTFAAKVTSVVVLGDFTLGLRYLPWPCSDGINPTAVSPPEKAPFRTAYTHVIAATKSLTNLQKIACATSAKLPGLNSTSDIDIATQARQCSSKVAVDHERPLKWSDTEMIIGLALSVPNITNIDAHCSTYDLLGDTESSNLLFPEGKSTKVREGEKYGGTYWDRLRILQRLNPQLRSLTYESVDDLCIPPDRALLGTNLLLCCSSITNVEVIISDVSINGYQVPSCMQACRLLESLCSFRVRLLDVDPTLLSANRRVDDDDPHTYAAGLQCASVFKEFFLQHARTLETCVIDSIVSTSEHQLNTFAGRLKASAQPARTLRFVFARIYASHRQPRKEIRAISGLCGL